VEREELSIHLRKGGGRGKGKRKGRDKSTEMGSVHDEEQRTENIALGNTIRGKRGYHLAPFVLNVISKT